MNNLQFIDRTGAMTWRKIQNDFNAAKKSLNDGTVVDGTALGPIVGLKLI